VDQIARFHASQQLVEQQKAMQLIGDFPAGEVLGRGDTSMHASTSPSVSCASRNELGSTGRIALVSTTP